MRTRYKMQTAERQCHLQCVVRRPTCNTGVSILYNSQKSRTQVRKPLESFFISFKVHVSRYKKAEYIDIPQECVHYDVIAGQ